MASRTRDARIIAAVPCPVCGAGVGVRCRNPVPHDVNRGPVDRRKQPRSLHKERRAEWVASKRRLETL